MSYTLVCSIFIKIRQKGKIPDPYDKCDQGYRFNFLSYEFKYLKALLYTLCNLFYNDFSSWSCMIKDVTLCNVSCNLSRNRFNVEWKSGTVLKC